MNKDTDGLMDKYPTYYDYYITVLNFIEANPYLKRDIAKEYFKDLPDEMKEYRHNQVRLESLKDKISKIKVNERKR